MSEYSITFTPRNTVPRIMVRISQFTVAWRLLVCAPRTAIAMVSELPISTAVLRPPQNSDSDRLASANASKYQMR